MNGQQIFFSTLGQGSGGSTPSVPTPVSTRPRVLIVSGQSNARGQQEKISIPNNPELTISPLSNRKIWNGSSFVDIEVDVNTNWPAPNENFGTELNYSYLVNNFWQNNFTDYIIKIAWNATAIEEWLTGGAYRNVFINWVNSALSSISGSSNNYSCVFYWDQGENNAGPEDDPTQYESLFTQMITDFRVNLNVRKLPCILREMRFDNTGHPKIAEIINQQKKIVQNVADTYLMNASGPSLYDGIHFNGEGQVELGKRLFEQAIYLFD